MSAGTANRTFPPRWRCWAAHERKGRNWRTSNEWMMKELNQKRSKLSPYRARSPNVYTLQRARTPSYLLSKDKYRFENIKHQSKRESLTRVNIAERALRKPSHALEIRVHQNSPQFNYLCPIEDTHYAAEQHDDIKIRHLQNQTLLCCVSVGW